MDRPRTKGRSDKVPPTPSPGDVYTQVLDAALVVGRAAQKAVDVFCEELAGSTAETTSGKAQPLRQPREATPAPALPAAPLESDGPALRNVAWLAEFMGCTEWAARNAIRNKTLPERCVVRYGGQIRVNEDLVRAWARNELPPQ